MTERKPKGGSHLTLALIFSFSIVRSPWAASISEYDETNPKSTVDISLSAGGVGTAGTVGTGSVVTAGYATLGVNSGDTPYGTAVITLRQNNVIVSEAGVPVSPPTTSARIFIDYRQGIAQPGGGSIDIDTGIAIVNRGTRLANIVYTLRGTDGNNIAAGHEILVVGAHQAKFVSQLKDVAPDFALPADFQTATGFGSLEVASDQPLLIVALRLTVNQRGDTLMTGAPIADMRGSPSSAPIYFPQFVTGGGYVTTLILLNTSDTTESGKLNIYGDLGAPMAVDPVGGTADSSFRYGIPVGGVFVFQTDGISSSASAGSVQLIPDAGTSAPVGAGVFRYSQNGIAVTESEVPATVPITRARIYVDKSGSHDTGLAIAAPINSGPTIALRAYQNDGTTTAGTGSVPIELTSNGHKAAFVDQLVNGLPDGFTGVLEISSASPFVALTLRSLTNERGDFLLATLPIADEDQRAPAPVFFAQIADGGGYFTQFILISWAGASINTLSLFGDSGAPLAVGK